MGRKNPPPPPVEVGQRWRDNKRPFPSPIIEDREKGRTEKRTLDVAHLAEQSGTWYAWCVTQRMRKVRIRVDRLKPGRFDLIRIAPKPEEERRERRRRNP